MHLRFRRSIFCLCVLLCSVAPLGAYSVLTHEEIVDMAWTQHSVPLLKARFPGITPEQIKEAHAYAYGGCIIQDLGYYPKSSKAFSDLLHYVRTGDFVEALLRDASTPDELAFALGALAHYTADSIGHPYVNQVTAMEFPKLRKKYGPIVTYEQDKTAHLRTEFGFDVVGVARGKYAQEDYRTFIGFEVAKPLLNRAFEETYGLKLTDLLTNEDRSIGTARWAVSTLIPKMTKVALLTYHDQIEHATPGFDVKKFRYRMNRTTYEKNWGKTYQKPGFGSHLLAILITILPKIGPLKALKLQLPNGDEQTIYIHSVNETVDRYQAQIDLLKGSSVAQAIPDASSDGLHPDADAAQGTDPASVGHVEALNAARMPLDLPPIDLDTGKPIAPGEYELSDKAHADLLARIVREDKAGLPAELHQHLLNYYVGPDASKNTLEKKPKDWAKVQANLQTLKTLPDGPVSVPSATTETPEKATSNVPL
ncbi:zinc dependent phospholipase C family protein [Terriglobus saanensis]|nr:zinc dependent phospholipase C family protein [Terriglobus saanensis]